MRCDDDYAWGGCNLHGLYNAVASGGGEEEVARDFLIFCRLARLAGAIPERWDWPAFLAHAAPMLRFAFEKSDAQEKYGGENIFTAALPGGGRSLRFTAEAIYGSSCMAGGRQTVEHEAMEEAVQGQPDDMLWEEGDNGPDEPDPLRHVGGRRAWGRLRDGVDLRNQPAAP